MECHLVTQCKFLAAVPSVWVSSGYRYLYKSPCGRSTKTSHLYPMPSTQTFSRRCWFEAASLKAASQCPSYIFLWVFNGDPDARPPTGRSKNLKWTFNNIKLFQPGNRPMQIQEQRRNLITKLRTNKFGMSKHRQAWLMSWQLKEGQTCQLNTQGTNELMAQRQ